MNLGKLIGVTFVLSLLLVGCGGGSGSSGGAEVVNGETESEQKSLVEVVSKEDSLIVDDENPLKEMMQYRSDEQMRSAFPNAYGYGSSFDFDLNIAASENFEIAKEIAKATVELLFINRSKDTNNESRILHGLPVDRFDTKWEPIVALIDHTGKSYCSGVLVTHQWILTAAHCVVPEIGKVSYPKILINSYHLKGTNLYKKSNHIYPHPGYAESNGKEHDIAFINIINPYYGVEPIVINAELVETDVISKIAGWGNMYETSNVYSTTLREINVPIIDKDVCKTAYAREGIDITDTMLCAGYMNGSKAICKGDDGGPLITQSQDGRYVLSGIASLTGIDDDRCGEENAPGVYTAIHPYLDWIKKLADTTLRTTSDFEKNIEEESSVPEKNVEEEPNEESLPQKNEESSFESVIEGNYTQVEEIELVTVYLYIEKANNIRELIAIIRWVVYNI